MKAPCNLTEIQTLIQNQVQESIHIEYKLSAALDDKHAEIAKDVSAFANSDGGVMIYGINEKNHIPIDIDNGYDHQKMSKERLESLIQSNIAPRIEGLIIHPIPLSNTNSIYTLEIPKSYRAPHQERQTKKYYKRFNFKSEPMEDYEIKDIRARLYIAKPLINIRIDSHGFQLFLIIENNGLSVASDIRFEPGTSIPWYSPIATPPLIARGITYLHPGESLKFYLNSTANIFSKDYSNSHKFSVDVSYFHPEIQQRIQEVFSFDLEDRSKTLVSRTDVETQGKGIRESIDNLTKELAKVTSALNALGPLANATGLGLSIPTVRSIMAMLSGKDPVQKISPIYKNYQVFQEVLSVDINLADALARHFWGSNMLKGINNIDGVTPKLIENIEYHFDVIWDQEERER